MQRKSPAGMGEDKVGGRKTQNPRAGGPGGLHTLLPISHLTLSSSVLAVPSVVPGRCQLDRCRNQQKEGAVWEPSRSSLAFRFCPVQSSLAGSAWRGLGGGPWVLTRVAPSQKASARRRPASAAGHRLGEAVICTWFHCYGNQCTPCVS